MFDRALIPPAFNAFASCFERTTDQTYANLTTATLAAIVAIGSPVARSAQDFLDWLDERGTPGEVLAELWNGTPSGLLIDDPAMAVAVFAQFRSTFAKALGIGPRRKRAPRYPAPVAPITWPDDFTLSPTALMALTEARQDFDRRHPHDPLGWIAISSPERASETTVRLAFHHASVAPPDTASTPTQYVGTLPLMLEAQANTLPRFIRKWLDFDPADGFFLRNP